MLPVLAGALLAYFGLKLLVPVLVSRAILDHPEDRRNHETPTPRGGGLAVVGAVLIVWLYFVPDRTEAAFLAFWFGAVVLTAVSFLDDMRRLGAPVRFAVQAAAVALALWAGPGLPDIAGVPGWAVAIAVGFLWVWFVNLFNFMDGIDGIAGVEAIAVAFGGALCLALAGHAHVAQAMALTIVGAALAFLAFNWHPARVFMGDSGSIPLGFMLGGLLVALLATPFWAAAVILPAYYWIDSGITILWRLKDGERVWTPHSRHAYQKAVRRGWRHDRVALTIAAFNLVMIALAVVSPAAPIICAAVGLGLALVLFAVLSGMGARQ